MRRTSETTTPERQMKTLDATDAHRKYGAGEPRLRRWPYLRWRRDVGFLFCILALCGLTIFIFSSAGGTGGSTSSVHNQNGTSAGGNPTVARTPTAPNVSSTSAAKLVAAETRNYSLNEPNPGVMQPAVDQDGNIWFGEMFANALARLNPQTRAITTWTPPNGQNNIMATAIDRQGNVWFTEQAANYIGRFDPGTQQFTTYPLEQVRGHSSAPQDLKFDAQGNLWFTEVNGGQIGRLNPATGTIVTWRVPAPSPGMPSLPFCLAIAPSGDVWFGDLSGGTVGDLDPSTGVVHLHQLASSQTEVYAMNVDPSGAVWFTELQGGKLGRIDTLTGTVSEIPVPTTLLGSSGSMYDLQVAKDGDVWFASAGANSLVRYVPQTQDFTFYQLAIHGSIPFGLALDSAGNLWFTASTSPNYIGVMSLA